MYGYSHHRKIYLFDGEHACFSRQDFAGIAKPEVWQEVQNQYDFQVSKQETYDDREMLREEIEP